MIRGLVVGKFAPLHKGHELLIGAASAQCDQLLILSYTSRRFTGCDAAHRRRWLSVSCPSAVIRVLDDDDVVPPDDAPDDVHRAFTAELLRSMGFWPDRVFSSESYGPGFAAYLARASGKAVAHVAVDPPRQACPISATTIRSDVHRHRAWLPGHVYADFVRRVALIGAESTGKTTLAGWLASCLGTRCAHEIGRDRWEERGGQLKFEDLLSIARDQIALEESQLPLCKAWLVCDTTPLTTLFYSRVLFGKVDPDLVTLASRSYDRLVLLLPDFPMVQDGTRQDEVFRQRQHDWYVRELRQRGLHAASLGGSLGMRQAWLRDQFASA